jgi:hypothetical protein
MAEDSTKGKAIINPKTYKGDSCIQVWLERRRLAMLSVWLDSNGVNTRFISDVVRESLNVLCEIIVSNGQGVEIDTITAGNILESKYRANLNSGGRGMKNLSHNLILEDRKVEARGPTIESDLDKWGDEGPPIGHPDRAAWRSRIIDNNWVSKDKVREYEEANKPMLTDEERMNRLRRKDIVPVTNSPAECKPFELITPDMFKKMTIEERKNMTFEQMKEMKRLLQTAHEQKIKDDEVIENERLRQIKKEAKKEAKEKIKEVVSNHNEAIRHKTDEELRIGQLEREKKERDMNSIMDLGIPEPAARASKGDLLPECNELVN